MKKHSFSGKIVEACRVIEAAEDMPRLDDLARQAGVSPSHFHRIFKEQTGVTPKAYADAQRQKKLAAHLRDGKRVTQAMYDAGYNSSGNFYAESSSRLGMTPRAYRKGGAGEDIRFAVGQCSLGAILVASTDKGICEITLDDDPEELVKGLQDRFPHARLAGGDEAFEQLVAQVIGLIEDPHTLSALPLDIRGTAFQQKVWQALRHIPVGRTISYTELATKIGSPSAVRAVASACAANKLAMAIPCHRVVRTDGSLSGYRWGVERKRSLLDREEQKTK